jgi:GAF domain-containing protein
MTTERIVAILNSVSQRVEKLIPSGRFYAVLYDSNKEELNFLAVRGKEGLSAESSRPCESNGTLPDLVILEAKSVLYENDLSSRVDKGEIDYWPDEKDIPHSWLGVPLIAGKETLGALVVESWQKTYSFNKDHESTLATVARQASIAIENAQLYEKLKAANEQLKRKVESLRILNELGRQLSSGIVKEDEEILNLVHENLTKLHLDTRNMYIVFYNPDPDKPDTADEIYGEIHVKLERNTEQTAPMKNRAAQKGLTEYVIRTKKSFNPIDVQQAYEQYAPDSQERSASPRALSWLGVPMISEGKVFGVIVLRNYETKGVYTDDDQEIVEILAGQIATALQNLRLYQAQKQAEAQVRASENMAIMSITAAEFAHKMNNLAGTIPVRIDMAKSLLDGSDSKHEKIIEHLEKIRNEADGILSAAKEIRESAETKAPEEVDIHQLLEIAHKRAENAHKNIQNNAIVVRKFSESLPLITVERSSLLDTMTSIIKNGMEAIADQGTITIETYLLKRDEKEFVEIRVSDTGEGIPSSELSKIFDLFYTTKAEKKGLGFGLWRDRTFIRRIGGDIDVQSEPGRGSTFTISIPCASVK